MLNLDALSVSKFPQTEPERSAVAVPQTLVHLFPDLGVGHLWTIAGYDVYASLVATGVVAAAAMTFINYLGLKPASVFQTIAVVLLVCVGGVMRPGPFVGG